MALFTYDDASRREDLLAILRDVSPVADNYLVTNLGTSVATQTQHEWLTFNIARPTSVTAVAEGVDPTYPTHTQPSRSINFTAIVTRPVQVSGTEQAVRVGLPGNPMDFQKKVALEQLKADMEWLIINAGAKASGASGTARQFSGIINVLSTNPTARNSGTSMSTTELEDLLQDCWNSVGSAYTPDIVLCPMGIKRKISTFTTRVTMYQDSADRIYNNIGYYESASGVVKIIPHKDLNNAAGTTAVLALREEMFKMAFLKDREPKYVPLAQTGDADKGFYITEFTLESLAQRASTLRTGYNQNG